MNYDHDQERLGNIAADFIKISVTVGTQIAAMRREKEVKVNIRTAKEDVNDVRQGLKEGKSAEEIAKAVSQSDVAKRIAKNGGNVEQYTGIIMQKAEMDNDVERMPTQSQNKAKTRRKTL